MYNKRIISVLWVILCHRFDNLAKKLPVPWKTLLPELMQGEMDNMTRPISIKKIESKMNNFLNQKESGVHGFNGEF